MFQHVCPTSPPTCTPPTAFPPPPQPTTYFMPPTSPHARYPCAQTVRYTREPHMGPRYLVGRARNSTQSKWAKARRNHIVGTLYPDALATIVRLKDELAMVKGQLSVATGVWAVSEAKGSVDELGNHGANAELSNYDNDPWANFSFQPLYYIS